MDTRNESNSKTSGDSEPTGKKIRAFFEKTVAGPSGTFPAGSTAEISAADFKTWEADGAVSRAK